MVGLACAGLTTFLIGYNRGMKTKQQGIITVGDTVIYRGNFGRGHEEIVKVTSMQLLEYPRDKMSIIEQDALWCSYAQIQENRIIFDLDNNKWCYAEQIVGRVDMVR